ncbi:MAG: hypothetical protein Q9187_007194, partial [Circinaria calcarea]
MADLEELVHKTSKIPFEIFEDRPTTPSLEEEKTVLFKKPFVPPDIFFVDAGPVYTPSLQPRHVKNWASTDTDPIDPLREDLGVLILETVLNPRSLRFLRWLAIAILKHYSYWRYSFHYKHRPALQLNYNLTLHLFTSSFSNALTAATDPPLTEQTHLRHAERILTRNTYVAYPIIPDLIYKYNAQILDSMLDTYDSFREIPRNESTLRDFLAASVRYQSQYRWLETHELDLD